MKLIVSDFDLTFYDSNYEENIKLINAFVDRGNSFVIATGRSFDLLKKDIENKNIKFRYLICSDGSVVLDENLNILYSVTFAPDVIKEILELLKNDTNLITLEIDENVNGISGVYATFNSLEYAKTILNDILNKYDVSGYISTHGINIINKNVSKVTGIEYIKNILNIENAAIYTIGDNINDLEMINKYNGYFISKDTNGIKNNIFKEFINKINN